MPEPERSQNARDNDTDVPITIVIDFNETLVLERTLIAWCRQRMRSGTLAARLAATLQCVVLGGLAMLADLLRLTTIAARVGFLTFRGTSLEELANWAGGQLTPEPRARPTLLAVAARHGSLRVIVVSRGTPECMIRGYLRGTGAAQLRDVPLASAIEIVAPELEVRGGRVTGRVSRGLSPKSSRARLAEGGIYIGDRRDRWARDLDGDRFRFIRL